MSIDPALSCSICYEDFESPSDKFKAHPDQEHFFHQICLKLWTQMGKNSCPICREILPPTSTTLLAVSSSVSAAASILDSNRSLINAARFGDAEKIEELLEAVDDYDPEVIKQALAKAIIHSTDEHLHVLKLLLDYKDVGTAIRGALLCKAAQRGNCDAAELLCQDGLITSAVIRKAIAIAQDHAHYDIVAILSVD